MGLALPVPIQEWAFRGPLRPFVGRLESGARLGGIDWAGTQAFSEEVNTFPSIWLNVQGREPQGIVEPGAEYENLRDEIIARLLDWHNPESGQPVIAQAWRREDLYHGPAVKAAPDIILQPTLDYHPKNSPTSLHSKQDIQDMQDSRTRENPINPVHSARETPNTRQNKGQGYTYTFLSSSSQPGEPIRKLTAAERLGAKGGSMNGSHRPDGVLLLVGSGVQANAHVDNAQISDVAPTLLHLLGMPLPSYFDGRVLGEALEFTLETSPSPQPSPPRREGACPPNDETTSAPSPYSADQAGILEERLRGLGYRP
jgi:predicted AlkP superfamily phosphohydrolase/phosphomutase